MARTSAVLKVAVPARAALPDGEEVEERGNVGVLDRVHGLKGVEKRGNVI